MRRSSQMRVLGTLAAAAILLSAPGCMMTPGVERIDAKFRAGWRPSRGECMFGGATRLLGSYCAHLNFGPEGVVAILRDHNQAILEQAQLGRLRCVDHVAQARAALTPYADEYEVKELYSCGRDPHVENGRKVCHVSLLVIDRVTRARFVMDNGYVLDPAVTRGVDAYAEFDELVEYAWTGSVPAWVAIASE